MYYLVIKLFYLIKKICDSSQLDIGYVFGLSILNLTLVKLLH